MLHELRACGSELLTKSVALGHIRDSTAADLLLLIRVLLLSEIRLGTSTEFYWLVI